MIIESDAKSLFRIYHGLLCASSDNSNKTTTAVLFEEASLYLACTSQNPVLPWLILSAAENREEDDELNVGSNLVSIV
jgi:hypothetical protein